MSNPIRRPSSWRAHVRAGLLLLGGTAGCTTAAEYAAEADIEGYAVLDETQDRSLGDRDRWVRYPDPAPEPEPPHEPGTEPGIQPPPATEADGAAGEAPPGDEEPVPDAPVPDVPAPHEPAMDVGAQEVPKPGEPGEPLETPLAAAAGDPDGTQPSGSGAQAEPLLLDLPTALSYAVTTGREFLNEKESLYLQGLGLTLTRYNFGPLLNSTVAYLWSDAKGSASASSLAWDAGVSQILPTGGTFSFGGGLLASHAGGSSDEDNDPLFDSAVNLNLTQPLLRGAGYEVSHEALTQAERSIVYSVRDFELFREDFSIGIARDFFDLVSQKQRLANLEQNFKDAQFDQTKAEALRQVDRNRDEDVFLARRRVINAETDLLSARADYEAAVDEFKLRLGLATSDPVVIADAEPPFEPVRLDADSAVAVALHNRLDLLTAAEQLEDTERSVRISRNGLMPDLNLVAGYGLTGSDHVLGDAIPDSGASNVGLTLDLPLNRQSERNSYRSALISLDRARRDYTLLTDNTERDIRDQLRQLERVEQQIVLQTEQIEQEQRAVAVTEIRYEAGDVDNRDLLDARQSLVDAQNALIDLKVDHFIARLSLLRDLGILFIDEKGMWTS